MASLFKRLFSPGGAQTASVQVEEPAADASAAGETVELHGAGDVSGEQPAPSEEELKEFLYQNFLDGARPADIAHADAEAATNATPATAGTADARVELDLPLAETSGEVAENSENVAAEDAGISAEGSPEANAETRFDAAESAGATTTGGVTTRGSAETPQIEADADIRAGADGEAGAASSTSAEHEMMAEIEVDSMSLDSPEVAAAFATNRVERALPPTLTEIPEALRPLLTEVIEESGSASETGRTELMADTETGEGAIEASRIDPSEWALEEALGNHKEWLDSRGVLGRKAHLRAAKLEGMELISANLRYADLQDANLRAADLLLADLREACMVRANLQDSCLVGANLEGANLEGASLESAMGLVPRQLAGCNLRDTSLPEHIAQFSALAEFSRAAQASARTFGAVMLANLVCCVMIWKTKDIQLVSDSAILPFLHSASAAAALPTAEIYLIAPVLLLGLYLLFQYQLQRLWDATLELPAIFPDGRVLGEKQPRIISGLLRLHFHWMNQDPPSTRMIEKGFSALLAYGSVPLVLILFWGRYLTLQEIHGTILQELLIIASVGIAMYATTKIGRQQPRWVATGRPQRSSMEAFRTWNPAKPLILLFAIFSFLSIGTIMGIPHGKERAPQFPPTSARRWAPTVLWTLGYDPYPNLTEAVISRKPSDWRGDGNESGDELAQVQGARLNESHFRYAQAYGIFLANAHLWRSDFYGAFLAEADLRGADLGQADLRFSILDQARLSHANFDRAQLDGANMARADMRNANLSYASLRNANMIDARLDGASLYGARLSSANMLRANMQKADLRDAQLDDARLEHADMQQAYLWSAKLPGAHLANAQLATAIFIDSDLSGADLRGAQFNGTVLNGANLQNANLDGADLRGALQLGAAQICSAKSRQGALLDESMQKLVDAQCGANAGASATPGAAGAATAGPTAP